MLRILRDTVADITPPIVLRTAKSLLGKNKKPNVFDEEEGEKGPEWYDNAFKAVAHWSRHYSESRYYFLWTVIADRIVREKASSLLEIGCGTGQLATLLRDKGIPRYHGFDFAPKRIEQARKACPEFLFTVENAFETRLFETGDYDAVICTEFLEHVERDIDVINRVRPGTLFYGTVPNFPFTSHVRHFQGPEEVTARYAPHFSDFRVDTFLADARGKTFFLLEGRTRGL